MKNQDCFAPAMRMREFDLSEANDAIQPCKRDGGARGLDEWVGAQGSG